VEVVTILALGRSVDQEAPLLAADLGLTAYETGVMLRAALPIIVLRTEDRNRSADVLAKLRARGHDAVAVDLAAVASSDNMFRPKTFRLDGSEIVGVGQGETQRLSYADIFAFVRATHAIQTEDTITTKDRTVSLSRAAATGGLMMTKTSERESKRVTSEREPVLYVFRSDATPWLLASQEMLYDGLGPDMRVSKAENFEVLLRRLRELAPNVPFDTRLLQVRAPSTIVSSGAKQMTSSSAGTLDVLAHVVTIALNRNTRPYR